MNTKQYPLSLKLYKKSSKLLNKLVTALKASFAGFWLGILDLETLQMSDGIFYENEGSYQDEDYNRSGLWDWEANTIAKYFSDCKSILLASAGGGREVYALSKRGYQVDAFECNPPLVDFANHFLQQEKIDARVILAPRNSCPKLEKSYDGAIIGWGAYTNIQGRENRIEFLQQMRSHLEVGKPIFLSFYPRQKSNSNNSFKLITAVANIIVKFRLGKAIELGDSLLPHYNFVHYFIEPEIKEELDRAKFNLVLYQDDEYGYAIGIAK